MFDVYYVQIRAYSSVKKNLWEILFSQTNQYKIISNNQKASERVLFLCVYPLAGCTFFSEGKDGMIMEKRRKKYRAPPAYGEWLGKYKRKERIRQLMQLDKWV